MENQAQAPPALIQVFQMETAHALATAVETVMSPYATNDERQKAQQICEDFKDNSTIAVQYGFKLAERENSAVVRHFGLQLIEHCIKFRWNDITDSDKDELKLNTLRIMDQGTNDMLVEELHIKDGISRIVVELMKRVWPQLWDSLFTDFTLICQRGPSQTELVLLTLLRFVEDVIRFQNVPQQRRQDLRAALSQAMGSIFSFLMFILNEHLPIYKSQRGDDSDRSRRVCMSVLETLTGFVDWVVVAHIQDSQIVKCLCSLLLDGHLCVPASECLLLIVGRKGRLCDRTSVLSLFCEENMTQLLQAAIVNNSAENITEFNFIFLKRLCEILLETGRQLGALWGSAELKEQPPNFEMYLKALIAFTQHPSQGLRHIIYFVWMVFLRHSEISQDPLFQAVIPTLVQCGTLSLHKVGYPSQNNSASCAYSRLEFDTDEEFNQLLSNLRMIVGETTRLVTLMYPKLTFSVVSSWLMENLSKPIEIGAGEGKNIEQGICNLSSPSFIAWDACSVFMEACMSRLFLAEGEKPAAQEGVALLHKLLDFKVEDPLILSAVLSCISALFPYLNHSPSSTPRVITKIFGAVQFNLPGQTKSKRSQAVKNVRTHACSVLVKVCKNYSDLFLPEFDRLYGCIKQLDLNPDQLSQMEKIILLEALIIISNTFHDFNRQSAFMEEIFAPIKQLWSSPDITKAFSSPECFMSYVGLNQPAVEPSSADTCGINRSHILYCINTIYAVIKRSQCPEDYNKAAAGGFVVDGPRGKVMRNPATAHVKPMMDNLVVLIKTATLLHKPEYMRLLHSDFLKAFDLMDHDKHNYLGIQPAVMDNSDSLGYRHPVERMKMFSTTVFETSYLILGNACSCFGSEFYSIPDLAKGINENLLSHFHLLPDFRAKMFIRNFIKYFVENAPKEFYEPVVIPVLLDLCPQVLQRLSERWQGVSKNMEEMLRGDDDEDPESQEILDLHVMRSLTKEYLDLLQTVLLGRYMNVEVKEEQEMEDDGGDAAAAQQKGTKKDLCDLGKKVTDTQELWPCIMMTVLTAFSWPDTMVYHRCVSLINPLCKELISKNQLTPDAVQHVFVTMLSSLQVHGHDDSCQSSLLTLGTIFYETYRPHYSCLSQVLEQIPNADRKLVKDFEEKMATLPKSYTERKRKTHFKEIVSSLIAKDISQKFQRSAQFSTLPRLFLESRRAKYPKLEEEDTENLGLCELFTPVTTNKR